jgi:hypothetical protein
LLNLYATLSFPLPISLHSFSPPSVYNSFPPPLHMFLLLTPYNTVTVTCSQTCQNGGTCTGINTCTCTGGWNGSDCSTCMISFPLSSSPLSKKLQAQKKPKKKVTSTLVRKIFFIRGTAYLLALIKCVFTVLQQLVLKNVKMEALVLVLIHAHVLAVGVEQIAQHVCFFIRFTRFIFVYIFLYLLQTHL